MWIEVIEGLLRLIINLWWGVIFWEKTGIPFELAFFLVTSYGIFWLIFTYCQLTNWFIEIYNWLAKFLRKWMDLDLENLIKKTKEQLSEIIRTNPSKYQFQEKLINWLTSKGEKMTLGLTFVPWVPILPTATTIAARLMKIPYAFPVLFAGSVFRAFVLCLTVYGFSAL